MKNIERLKQKYFEHFSEKYYKKDTLHKLSDKDEVQCYLLAEFWAYVKAVVPDGHLKDNIFDFDGYSVDKNNCKEEAVPNDIAIFAKNQICNYCWGIGWDYIKEQISGMSKSDISMLLRKRNVMMDRFKNGNNVIIFGSSSVPIGRTMIASIIMKEAIRSRILNKARGQTYDWVDFSMLKFAIAAETFDYNNSDWLVVDNIMPTQLSEKQTAFMIDKIDPFFIERCNNNLPTILVFKFDIRSKSFSIEKRLGVGISRIINSKKTFSVPLSEEMIEKNE